MAEKQLKPFDGIDDLYRQYENQIASAIIFLIQGFLFVVVLVIALIILLATGIFVL